MMEPQWALGWFFFEIIQFCSWMRRRRRSLLACSGREKVLDGEEVLLLPPLLLQLLQPQLPPSLLSKPLLSLPRPPLLKDLLLLCTSLILNTSTGSEITSSVFTIPGVNVPGSFPITLTIHHSLHHHLLLHRVETLSSINSQPLIPSSYSLLITHHPLSSHLLLVVKDHLLLLLLPILHPLHLLNLHLLHHPPLPFPLHQDALPLLTWLSENITFVKVF